MDENMSAILGKAFREVLEHQVFLFADPVEGTPGEDWIAGSKGFLLLSMGFRGECEGHVTMAVPDELAAEIGSNFLGRDVDDPVVLAATPDACKELLNVVCGHVLTALHGEEPVFDLSMPRLTPLRAQRVFALARQPGALAFTVDGAPLLLGFGANGSGFPASEEE